MKTVRELKQKRAALLDQANALIDQADQANRDLTVEERGQVDSFMQQADGMQKDIQQREQLEGMRGELRNASTQPNMDPSIGMTDREVGQYSIVRAIRAMTEYLSGNARALDEAGLELEASRAVAQKLGREPRSFFVPFDWMVRAQVVAKRDMMKGDPSLGGYLVGTDLQTSSFIELLRNRMVLRAAGAMVLGGLVGDVDIPKQTGGATWYWVGEGGEPSESTPTVGQMTLRPRTGAAYTDVTRRLIKQSSLDVEMFMRNDLAMCAAIGIDYAGLHGLGAANQPRGIQYTTGIGDVNIGNDGGAPTWGHIVQLETEVAVDNADVGRLAYITNPKVRGKLKTTPKVANTETMIWNDNSPSTPLNGYPCHVTNQVRSDLAKGNGANLSAGFFGNWADLLLAMWGVLDILVDPYTGSKTGTVRVTAFQDVDVATRHAESFAMCDEWATS